MAQIVAPLKAAGQDGVLMGCADGNIRCCYPIHAAYIANNPEQCLISCVKNNTCHWCDIPAKQRGDYSRGVPCKPDRTVLNLAAKALNVATTTTFVESSLNPVDKPFWADLPHTDIFQSLTPDLLHQLHCGVFKDHLLKWCQTILTNEEIDQRFRAQAHHPTLKHFNNGVSSLSQTTGKEHKNMEKVFVGVMHGGADPHLVRAAVGMIDFIYLASLPIHTEESILALEGALKRFHDDKQIFIQLGGRELEHFKLNKLHAVMHYAESIWSRGALDGYNTKWSERLHIDFAKKGYRASNHINYTPQMAQWLSRREKVVFYRHYLEHMGAITPQGY
jgi:hypothetical protein